jgi:hypothetical protein
MEIIFSLTVKASLIFVKRFIILKIANRFMNLNSSFLAKPNYGKTDKNLVKVAGILLSGNKISSPMIFCRWQFFLKSRGPKIIF